MFSSHAHPGSVPQSADRTDAGEAFRKLTQPIAGPRIELLAVIALGCMLVAGVLTPQSARSGAESADRRPPAGGAGPAAADSVPLYEDLGSHHHEITTAEAAAQAYFDQGLRLTYAFNHAEAIRAFREAARIDSSCAMCWWGVALAYGPNINLPMDSASAVVAYEALREALERAPKASERERAYIEALAKRYAPEPAAERAALDSAYARAMGEVADRWPEDLDAATLHAEALMDLSPWDYWTRAGRGYEPRPDTPRLVERLEMVLAESPEHPGACHYYIHAVEAAYPEKAVPCAERLARLMPGAGHLVHMPGHIYIRVGRYADAIAANEHAVHQDETYIADQRPAMGVYVGGYYPHNYHFLAFASTLAGRSGPALEAARAAAEKMPVEIARSAPEYQQILVYPQLVGIAFGRWDEVLELPLPESDLPVATALAQYARGVAFAAQRQIAQAEEAFAAVRRLGDEQPEGPMKTVLAIARHSLEGEIAARSGRLEEAVASLREAARLEDSLLYIEPPHWPRPIRPALGAVLLEAGKPDEAEEVYREDLARFPENGWSLRGLAESVSAQGRKAEAEEAEARFKKAWQAADVTLTASRF